MRRPMFFNMFLMNTPSHMGHGTWRHPQSRSVDYNKLETWIDLAKLAERGKLDAVFFADTFGLYGEYRGSWKPLADYAVQFPISDPAMLISALAAATEHVGFIYTNSVLQQHPFAFARSISTLDHLTNGRVGWNIVTSASKNGSRSMGFESIIDHDERYRWAEEYADVTYKLWEGSWDEGAVRQDVETGLYSDSSKIHKINHVGERYRVEGPHLVEPSPQRTPVIFQAGASAAGLAFAARNTEGAFLVSGSPEAAARKIEAIRSLATASGRAADDIRFIEGLSFIVGSTEEEAQRKKEDIDQYRTREAQTLMTAGTSGLDLAAYDPATPLTDLLDKTPGMHGQLQVVMDSVLPGKTATVQDMLDFSTSMFTIVGTPESIADRLADYAAVGIDGVNIINDLVPGTYSDFIDHVAPVLQKRGLMQREYGRGTLREKMFPGRGAYINTRHPAAQYRGAFED